MGGNLLLDIGPKADGTIPGEQVTVIAVLLDGKIDLYREKGEGITSN